VVEEIVARVNNQIITRSSYQHEQQQLVDEAKQQDPAHADQIAAEEAKDVLRGLIDQQLWLQKGKDQDDTAD
jgi:peptidyl-prolyl cis-trans isomerase SurA